MKKKVQKKITTVDITSYKKNGRKKREGEECENCEKCEKCEKCEIK